MVEVVTDMVSDEYDGNLVPLLVSTGLVVVRSGGDPHEGRGTLVGSLPYIPTKRVRGDCVEGYNPREFRDTVLQAGYDLYEQEGHNYFNEYAIEQFLNQAGMQDIPNGRIRPACDYLLETGQFRSTEVVEAFAITASGIDQVEGDRER